MASLGDLVVKMSLDSAGFQSDMGRAAYAAEKSSARIVAAGTLAAAGIAAMGVAAVKAGVAMVGSIKGAIDAADELGKVAQRTGVAVESLSALKHAAELSDVSFEELTSGLQKLSKAIDSNDKAFKRLGLDARSFKTPDDALAAVADKFAQMEDGAEKAAIALQLFGKSGDRLIPLLNGGAAGLAEMRKEAERLGIVVSRDMARAAEQFNDSLTTLQARLSSVGIALANDVLPVLNKTTAELEDGIRISGGFREAMVTMGTINPFRSLTGNIKALNAELADLKDKQAAVGFDAMADGLVDVSKQIDTVTKQLQFLKQQQQREALAITGGARDLDPRDILGRGPTAPRAARSQQSEEALKAFEARSKAMQRELDNARKLTEVQQLRLDMERGMYDELTKAQKDYLMGQAKQIDAVRAQTDAAKLVEEADRRLKALAEKNANEAEQIASRKQRQQEADSQKAFDDWWDGVQKQEKKQEEANARINRRLEDDAKERAAINERELAKMLEQMDEAKRIREQYQEIFTGGLGDAFVSIIDGTKGVADAFEDMGRSILHSITQIAAQKAATHLIESLFGGASVGGIGGFFADVFGPAKAFGGPFNAGDTFKVGERGPEYIRPGFAGRIDPISGGEPQPQGNVIYMNVTTPDASSFRRSQQQILADMQTQLGRSEARR